MTAVGFVGLGTMGREMAANLVKRGHNVRGYDVSREALAACPGIGVSPAASLAEAARESEIVVTMLPDTPEVEEVLLGPNGLRENPPKGRLIVDMSTVSAVAARRMAEALRAVGVTLLDAPVSGGVQGARDARLSVMVGGPAEAFEQARPVLEAMGKTVVHVGETGAGQAVKACNQIVCAMNLQAICEALALGRAAGLDLEKLRDVLMGGAANSWMLENLGPAMLAKDARAGFRIDLQLKDLRLAGELGFMLGVPLPGAALAMQLYLEARAHGEGRNGNQALFRVYDRLSNQTERES